MIGTGAGGGILAYRLAKAGADVLVINSGGIPAQSEFQNELSPEQKGHVEIRPHTTFPVKPEMSFVHPLLADAHSRSSVKSPADEFQHYQIHHVNGLQNLWNGICLRYSEDDFANRHSYSDDCRWPISLADLAGHYSAAERLGLVVGEPNGLRQFPDGEFYEPREARPIDRLFMDSNAGSLGPDIFFLKNRKAVDLRPESERKCVACGNCGRGCRAGSVYKFSTHLLPEIRSLPNFRLLEHARAIRLAAGSDDTDGFSISHVIALDERTQQIIEIEADVVIVCAGAIESPRLLLNSFADDRSKTGQVGEFLQDSPRVVAGSSLFRLWFHPAHEDRGYGDHILVGGQTKDSQGERFPFVGQFWSDFLKVPYYLAEMPPLPRLLKETIARQVFKSTVTLILYSPAVPRRENKVVLADAVDRFGQRQVRIVYEKSETEKDRERQLAALARRMLKKASGYVVDGVRSPAGSSIHYAGTCRMGADPKDGVVDKHLKYFGSRNLYVCDGSVIPVLSEKHPTLTIMALAHRLAERLIGI
ncbi:MAG TPA: GMC family oxidoreductase [Bryobacteraceae bacterium]|nr:GMC family oxidoreductase [Bryobacteraceae bacterium]